MINFISFPDRLKMCIKESGRTQKDLAPMLGITPYAFTKYFHGRIPEVEVLYKMSKVFNRSMEWLLTGENSPLELQCECNLVSVDFNHELKMMIDILTELMSSEEKYAREWTVFQFEKAFHEYVDAYNAEKKQNA